MIFCKKIIFCCLVLTVTHCYSGANMPKGLDHLENELKKDLELIHFPGVPFGASEEELQSDSEPVYDVVIVGGGMAGLAAAAALYKEGIFNIQLYDENPQGLEGPWLTYARMKTLRSSKDEMGPALDIPKLTFQAWYEAQFGEEKWQLLDKIPNHLWMDYLNWYRRILDIPVENECKLVGLTYENDHFILRLKKNNQISEVQAIKVVLATGRGGFGGAYIPAFVEKLTKENFAHVMETIDYSQFKNKVVGVVGCGASAFDAAAAALEAGAKKVELLMRATRLPCVNKLAYFHSQCFGLGYYGMSKKWRWNIMQEMLSITAPPPIPSMERVRVFQNFMLNSHLTIKTAIQEKHQVILETNKGKISFDFLILATGYKVDGSQQEEIKDMIQYAQLWEDQVDKEDKLETHLKLYPFLGNKFQFLEKIPGEAPYLKDLHCFNHASTLSHGIICRDITHISLGAKRLAEGIAADFLAAQEKEFLGSVNDVEPDFNPDDYFPEQ